MAPVYKTGELPCHTTEVDPGKYNACGVPFRTPTRGYDLEDNDNYAEGKGGIQRYRVGGGNMEVVQFHH